MRVSDTARSVAIVLLLGSLAACGKKGPPLAPLRLVPAAVTELGARRSGDDVELRFVLPTANANGPEAIDLGRVEVYAITIAAGAATPPNRDLLTKARVVGTIAVRPPPEEGEGPESGTPGDKRPAPGERVVFVDQLTAEKLKPVVVAQPATPDPTGQKPAEGTIKPDAAAVATEAGGQKPVAAGQKPEAVAQKPEAGATAPAPAAPAPIAAPYPTRIYAVRGLSRSGRPGPASARAIVPIIAPVAPPSAVIAQLPTAQAIVIDWTPPVAEPGTPPLAFNVYRGDATGAPLNPSPVAEARFEMGGVEYGKELCFVVRTVQAFESVAVESAPSAPACLTPLDKFPPAAPTGLRTVAEDGAISLVWEQSAEPDLSGYLVLRGEAPGDTLQPLTPQPITDASFRDATVMSGVRYVYAVVAVDTATPRNASAPSAREEVTAR